jgi:hypothetical protein
MYLASRQQQQVPHPSVLQLTGQWLSPKIILTRNSKKSRKLCILLFCCSNELVYFFNHHIFTNCFRSITFIVVSFFPTKILVLCMLTLGNLIGLRANYGLQVKMALIGSGLDLLKHFLEMFYVLFCASNPST